MNRNLKPVIILGGIIGIVFVGALFLVSSGVGINNFGNVNSLSLIEDHRSLNCEAFNKLGVTKNGVFSTVASGRDGFNPFVDSSLLTVTSQGVEIESFHVQLWLSCKGDFIKDSNAVTVSGTNNLLLCGDPSNAGTTCLLSDERRFQQINGIASSTTQFNSFPLGTFALPEDEEILIYQGNIRADDIERIFGLNADSIVFTSKMFPQLTFTFNHKTLGIFTATHDALALGQLEVVYAQWNGIGTSAPPPPDADGDGTPDFEDACADTPTDQVVVARGCSQEQLDALPPIDDPIDCTVLMEAQNPECLEDSDGDGLLDFMDQCPDLFGEARFFGCPAPCPQGLTPNPDGTCPDAFAFLDEDGDGVLGGNDLCPNSKPLAIVDSDGCELTQLDIGGQPMCTLACIPPDILVSPCSCEFSQALADFEGFPDDTSGDGSLTTLPPPLTKAPTGLLSEQFCREQGLVFQSTQLGCTQGIVDESGIGGSSIPIPMSREGELEFSDIIIFAVIGIVIAVPAIILIRRRK